MVRQLRRQRGWSIEDLASRAGISGRTLQSAETGEHRPRRATMHVIALALGVEPDLLHKQ